MKRCFFVLRFIFVFCLSSIFLSGQTVDQNYWDGLIYVKFDPAKGAYLPEYVRGQNAEVIFERFPFFIDFINRYQVYEFIRPFRTQTADIQSIYRIRFDAIELIDQALKDLLQFSDVIYAEKSPIMYTFYQPGDPLIQQQYYLSRIQAYDAWDIWRDSRSVKIAVIDDAIRMSHPDLIESFWVNPHEIPGNGIDDDGNGYIDDISGWDAADNDNNPDAPSTPPAFWGETAFTHGTHTSGLAAATTDNNIGIASVSFNAALIPIKAVSNSSWLPLGIQFPAEGVDYAIAAGADIVSMSFGSENAGAFTTLQTLIDEGYNRGMIFVAAAGNNGDGSQFIGTPNAIMYPAAYPNVIAVGATDQNDVKPGFSQYGTWLDVMAPGVNIMSTLAWSTPYGNQSGTSMSCPIVASLLALMKAYMPDATRDQIISCLKNSCDNIDSLNPQYAGQMGSGRINAYQSLLCLQQLQYMSEQPETFILLYPNPCAGELSLKFRDSKLRNIQVINNIGKVVHSTNCTSDHIKLNLHHIADGTYICRITDDISTTTRLFIKK